MDDKNKQGPQDRSRINVNESYELQYWSERFGISREELRKVVDKVGVSVSAVEEALKNR